MIIHTAFFSMTLFNINIALEFCSQTINQKCPVVTGSGPFKRTKIKINLDGKRKKCIKFLHLNICLHRLPIFINGNSNQDEKELLII